MDGPEGEPSANGDYPHRGANNPARKKERGKNRQPAANPIANCLAPIRLGRQRVLSSRQTYPAIAHDHRSPGAPFINFTE